MRKYPKILIFFSFVFLLINILQAVFTDLHGDEAYYWRYAQELDWGYFDHPPITALMIKIGGLVFQGELGVRLVTVVFSFISIFLLWELLPDKGKTEKKNIILFFLIYVSMPIFNMYGFITTPDVFLIFFGLIFLLVFKKFKTSDSIYITFGIGLLMALLMYSKYHGALIIIFCFLSDIRLIKYKKTWLSILFALGLFIPHIFWQINNDFPSIRFHLVERNTEFEFRYFIEYFLNVLIILNPFLLLTYLTTLKKMNQKDKGKRTYKFIFWSFIIFFSFSSLRGHVEPHWVAFASVPLVILLYDRLLLSEKIRKAAIIFSLITIPLIIFARIFLIFDLIPVDTKINRNKEMTSIIEENASELPVIFINSYTDASLYEFYTGKKSFSSNNIWYRRNQFDIWNIGKEFNNKEVFLVFPYEVKGAVKIEGFNTKAIYYKRIKNYITAEKLNISMISDVEELIIDKAVDIELLIKNPYPYNVSFISGNNKLDIYLFFYTENKLLSRIKIKTDLPEFIEKHSEISVKGTINLNALDADEYEFYFSFKQNDMQLLFNSIKKKIILKEMQLD